MPVMQSASSPPVAALITIRVVYLARLRDALGHHTESLSLADGATVAMLVDQLRARGGAFHAELAPGRPVRSAVNHAMVGSETVLRDGDEVALFPPVTGG